MYWNEEESRQARSSVGIVQIYSDNTKCTLKLGAFFIYPLHGLMLSLDVTPTEYLLWKYSYETPAYCIGGG